MMTLGLSPALGSAPTVSVPAGPNPNLLRWTEEFGNAVWTATAATIAEDVQTDPLGGNTADSFTDGIGGGSLRQTTLTAAASGSAATALFSPTASWARYSVSGTFDALAYTFSVWVLEPTASATLRLRLDRFAGKLRCSFEDTGAVLFYLWGAQLEQAAAAGPYTHRTI